MECRKVYVDVSLFVSKDGRVRPRSLVFEDGRVFHIECLKDVCRAASTKVGGIGIRYTIRVLGHETYLFDENGRWFVEAKIIS